MAGLSLVFCRRTQGLERESHLLGVTQLGGLRNSSLCFPREQSLVSRFSCWRFVRVDAGGPDPLGLCILVSQIMSRAPPGEGAVQAEQGHVCRVWLGAGHTARTVCRHMRGLMGFGGQRWERMGTQPEPGVSRARGVSGGCREDARGVAWAHTSVSPQILAALPMDWQGTHLLACACLRVVFIPLFILCVYPSSTPALRHPAWPCILSLLMGISNGYFGSVPMILAAGKVSPKQRELAGKALLACRTVHCQAGKPRPVEVKTTQREATFGSQGQVSLGARSLGTFANRLPPRSSHSCLVSPCRAPGTVLGSGDTVVTKR